MYDETLERMLETGYCRGTQWASLTQEQKERVAAGDFSCPEESGLNNIESAVRLIRAGVPQRLSTAHDAVAGEGLSNVLASERRFHGRHPTRHSPWPDPGHKRAPQAACPDVVTQLP